MDDRMSDASIGIHRLLEMVEPHMPELTVSCNQQMTTYKNRDKLFGDSTRCISDLVTLKHTSVDIHIDVHSFILGPLRTNSGQSYDETMPDKAPRGCLPTLLTGVRLLSAIT